MPEVIFTAAFAVFAAVSALLAISSSRKCASTLHEMRRSLSALATARSKIEVHDAELDRVTDALERLRGKFYAERRKYSTDAPPADRPAGDSSLKDELRRKVGLIAGRPAPHR